MKPIGGGRRLVVAPEYSTAGWTIVKERIDFVFGPTQDFQRLTADIGVLFTSSPKPIPEIQVVLTPLPLRRRCNQNLTA